MATRVFGWLKRIRKVSGSGEIIDLAERHIELTISSVRLLNGGVDAAIEGKQREKNRIIRALVNVSFEADEVRRSMIQRLAKLTVSPEERDDLFRLVDRLNRIVDRVREAARITTLLPFPDMGLETQSNCHAVTTHLLRCGEALIKTISALEETLEKVNHEADGVSRWEEIIDDDNQKIRQSLLTLNNKSAGVLILLNSFSLAVEEAGDLMENLSDICRSISSRNKPL